MSSVIRKPEAGVALHARVVNLTFPAVPCYISPLEHVPANPDSQSDGRTTTIATIPSAHRRIHGVGSSAFVRDTDARIILKRTMKAPSQNSNLR